ncbi:hypothetical protein AURDEDRAFT_173192, partial [Auricularia subglabra TFB-10046 SS5]
MDPSSALDREETPPPFCDYPSSPAGAHANAIDATGSPASSDPFNEQMYDLCLAAVLSTSSTANTDATGHVSFRTMRDIYLEDCTTVDPCALFRDPPTTGAGATCPVAPPAPTALIDAQGGGGAPRTLPSTTTGTGATCPVAPGLPSALPLPQNDVPAPLPSPSSTVDTGATGQVAPGLPSSLPLPHNDGRGLTFAPSSTTGTGAMCLVAPGLPSALPLPQKD